MNANKSKTSDKRVRVRIVPKQRPSRIDDAANLRSPRADDWEEIIDDLKLTKVQADQLANVVRDALMDIFTYHDRKRGQKKFKDYVLHLKKVDKHFQALIEAIEEKDPPLTEFLPLKVLEELGRMFSFSGLGAATGKELFPETLPDVLEYQQRNNLPISVESIERFYSHTRADKGLVHGRELILHVLKTLREPIAANLKLQSLDRGGRPQNVNKKYMIERLVRGAVAIFKMSEGQYVDAPIVDLCYVVMVHCGFQEEGIEKEVLAELRRREARRVARVDTKGPGR
jgi:hypothetical protein